MSTPDIKNPVGLPKEVSGVNLPSEVQAEVADAKAKAEVKAPTGISSINIHTPEGRAAVTRTLLDLGLTMPEFMSGADSKFISNLGGKATGQLTQLATSAAALTAPGSDTSTAATADLQGRWADFVAGQQVGGAMDVNSLVQFVLREAYMENTKDLHFYAQKVRFYNELKKMIRNELTKAREYLAAQAGSKPEDALKGGYSNSTGGTGPLSFPTEPQFDETSGAMVPHDPTSNYDAEFNKKEHLETYIKNLEEQLNSVGDDAQLANVDLQNMLQKQQQTLQMMSNISKMLHDTAMAIIRKIGS
jgi:hypothetical protein